MRRVIATIERSRTTLIPIAIPRPTRRACALDSCFTRSARIATKMMLSIPRTISRTVSVRSAIHASGLLIHSMLAGGSGECRSEGGSCGAAPKRYPLYAWEPKSSSPPWLSRRRNRVARVPVAPLDTIALSSVLIVVAVPATLLPARRASGVAPVAALDGVVPLRAFSTRPVVRNRATGRIRTRRGRERARVGSNPLADLKSFDLTNQTK